LPCWAGLFAFEAPLALSFDGARFVDHPILDFVACGPSKPGRAPAPCYVVHATPAWSAKMLEEGQEVVTEALLAALLDLADSAAKPYFAAAHRWRYARVGAVADNGVAYDWDAQLGVCGDWLSGPRVESAWLSGYRLGLALRARLAAPVT
jgi:predicted NAD/FAD-dependent oxidoreductase